jgi:hypothetical protein
MNALPDPRTGHGNVSFDTARYDTYTRIRAVTFADARPCAEDELTKKASVNVVLYGFTFTQSGRPRSASTQVIRGRSAAWRYANTKTEQVLVLWKDVEGCHSQLVLPTCKEKDVILVNMVRAMLTRASLLKSMWNEAVQSFEQDLIQRSTEKRLPSKC